MSTKKTKRPGGLRLVEQGTGQSIEQRPALLDFEIIGRGRLMVVHDTAQGRFLHAPTEPCRACPCCGECVAAFEEDSWCYDCAAWNRRVKDVRARVDAVAARMADARSVWVVSSSEGKFHRPSCGTIEDAMGTERKRVSGSCPHSLIELGYVSPPEEIHDLTPAQLRTRACKLCEPDLSSLPVRTGRTSAAHKHH